MTKQTNEKRTTPQTIYKGKLDEKRKADPVSGKKNNNEDDENIKFNTWDETDEYVSDPQDFISSLPEEIWLNILGFLSLDELCKMGPTCHGFLQLSWDPLLWSSLTLDAENSLTLEGDPIASTATLKMLISRCPQLCRIKIRRRKDICCLLDALSLSCPCLQTLEVECCPILTYSTLKNLVGGCSNLEVLSLFRTGCHNEDLKSNESRCNYINSFCQLFAGFTKLTTLNLTKSTNLSSLGLDIIAETCQKLERFNIEEVEICDDSFNRFIGMCGLQMKELKMWGNDLSDESFVNFNKFENLEVLSLKCAFNIGSRGLSSINQLSKLEWLDLSLPYIDHLEAADFATAFKSSCFSKLQHLKLFGCQINDEGLSNLALNCPNLSYVSLICSKVTDEGIASVARNCPKLTTIRLHGLDVSDAGIICLINKCKYLVTLDLYGLNSLLGKFMPLISRLLPRLRQLEVSKCLSIKMEVLKDLARHSSDLVVKCDYERLLGG